MHIYLDSIVLDIVFFGESLPSEFYHNLDEDSEKVYLYDTMKCQTTRPLDNLPQTTCPELQTQ